MGRCERQSHAHARRASAGLGREQTEAPDPSTAFGEYFHIGPPGAPS